MKRLAFNKKLNPAERTGTVFSVSQGIHTSRNDG